MSFSYKRLFLISLLTGLVLMPAFIFSQTTEELPGVPQEKVEAALADLSRLVHFEVKTVAEAKDTCNQEQYLQPCIDVGKKYSLYSAEEVKTVDIMVSELRGKVMEDLQKCTTEECLIKVANDLSKKLLLKNSELASQLDLTSKKIEEKKIIVDNS